MKNSKFSIVAAGIIGCLAAIGVGIGEFLLHYDALGRFGEQGGYAFFLGIDFDRTTVGHYLGVLSAPFYIIGFWHFMKMLEPAGRLVSRIAFGLMSYGIIVGAVWIGSRASISSVVNYGDGIDALSAKAFISMYVLRYENLLQITRLSVLGFSLLFVGLVITGRSYYPRWVAIFNPLLLILASFFVWWLVPAIGIFLMPVALNVAFAVLFLFSIYFSQRIKE